MLINTRIEAGLRRVDKDTRNEKKASNELYISKLINLTHFHCVKIVQIRSSFWSVFSCIQTEYVEIRSISPYSV